MRLSDIYTSKQIKNFSTHGLLTIEDILDVYPSKYAIMERMKINFAYFYANRNRSDKRFNDSYEEIMKLTPREAIEKALKEEDRR